MKHSTESRRQGYNRLYFFALHNSQPRRQLELGVGFREAADGDPYVIESSNPRARANHA